MSVKAFTAHEPAEQGFAERALVVAAFWIAFFVAWYLLGIPWGRGAPV